MTFRKGASGNPAGRPLKQRALTDLLHAAGSKTLAVGDKRIARKRLIADMMWELATTGRVTLPDGRIVTGSLDDQIAAVKWIYAQIDGPPRQDITLDGEITTLIRRYEGVDVDKV